jgi:hypothetical protein
MLTLSEWINASNKQREAWIEDYSRRCHLTYDQIEMLVKSPEVVNRFFHEAHKIAEKRTHYSARTIIEVLRHYSALEDCDKSFKINNVIATSLSRLSMEMFPRLNGFFETRSPTFKLES